MTLVALVVGVVLAAVGGDRFVRGAVGLARALGISPGIVGATVAAFATSSPELSLSVVAAVGGDPGIALGDATGSNVVNLGVVLGLTVCFVPVVVRWGDVRRDLPAVLAATAVLGVLAADGRVSRLDAVVLLVLFVAWLVWAALDARRDRDVTAATLGARSRTSTLVDLGLGLVLLVVAGRLVVTGAKGIGDALGWDDFLVGAVLVAIATSTPEMVTALVAVGRGHAEVGVGAILGSNVFNALFIVGTAGVIAPIPVRGAEVGVAIAFGLLAALAAIPDRRGALGRSRGVVLVACYCAYVVTILLVQ